MSRSKIVIVGGGFAAVKCARTLRSRLSRERCEIVLYSHENHMAFHPLLAEVAGASIRPDSAGATLRQMLPGVECLTETVERVDIEPGQIEFQNDQGQLARANYDHVVIACGAESNLSVIPGMHDHGFPFKTVRDAVTLRSHVIDQLEKAEVCVDPVWRQSYLSFVIVGGGYSGVEVAGEINDLVRRSARFYGNIGESDISVTLVHSGDHVLPEVSLRLRGFAQKRMERAGIKLLLNTRAAAATPEGLGLQDGRMIRAATVVCTIGTAPSPIVQQLDLPKMRGRLVTDPDMRVSGHANIWAIGDCAYVANAFDDRQCPPTAQFAEREGRQAAENIVSVLRGEPTRSFYFKQLGQLCSLGGRRAVGEMFGFRISGFLAWLIWRGVYLLKLPSWSRRIRVGLDWGLELVFPRDLGILQTDHSQHITRSYYRPGDFIYRRGDPANFFYAIEQGEVEVLRNTDGLQSDRPFAVLGPGEFLGEAALNQDPTYLANVRARTAVRLVATSRDVFSERGGTMAPVRDTLAESVKRRSENVWLRFPAASEILSREPLSFFLEPIPACTLKPESTIGEAIDLLTSNKLGFIFVLDDQSCLYNVLKGIDLTRAFERLAYLETDDRRDLRKVQLKEFLSFEPLAVSADDSSLLAASIMYERGLGLIPVVISKGDRHLKGYVRAETVSYKLLQQLGRRAATHGS